MKRVLSLTLFAALCLTGCTSTPKPQPQPNPYWPTDNKLERQFDGQFTCTTGDGQLERRPVKVSFQPIDSALYRLQIEPIEGFTGDNARFDLGYFYVTPDKIYRLDTTFTVSALTAEQTGEVVCHNQPQPDPLPGTDEGWHASVTVAHSRSMYHGYNNQVDTGFSEQFTWLEGTGLVYYRSQYGADRDVIELSLDGCAEPDAVKVSSITAYELRYNVRYFEFLFDLEQGTVYERQAIPLTERDDSAANFGYDSKKQLPEGAADQLKTLLADNSIGQWQNAYRVVLHPNVFIWGAEIVFEDGTHKKVFGTDSFPVSFQAVNQALSAYTTKPVWLPPDYSKSNSGLPQ